MAPIIAEDQLLDPRLALHESGAMLEDVPGKFAEGRLVVEVVSPSLRDQHRNREEKMEERAELGIRFCWLVDAQALELPQFASARSRGELPPPRLDSRS